MANHYPPTNEESVRPYRLWDAKNKCLLSWRAYRIPRNAHTGALIEARYAEVGVTIEVFDIRNGRLMGQYTRRPTTVTFMETSHAKG